MTVSRWAAALVLALLATPAAAMQQDSHPSCTVLGCGSLERISAANLAGATCEDLYLARNAIYFANGYCFKTQRAIATFGNAGCRWRNDGEVPFTRLERANIDSITAVERRSGCR